MTQLLGLCRFGLVLVCVRHNSCMSGLFSVRRLVLVAPVCSLAVLLRVWLRMHAAPLLTSHAVDQLFATRRARLSAQMLVAWPLVTPWSDLCVSYTPDVSVRTCFETVWCEISQWIELLLKPGSLSAQISDRRGRHPPTTVGVRKLEWMLFHVVSKYPQFTVWFCHKARVWQKDGGQTETESRLQILC